MTTLEQTQLAALQQQVARLAATERARALLHDYARACDGNDVAGVVDLFTPDAEVAAGARGLHGQQEIEAFYAGALGVPTCHVVGVAHQRAVDGATVESDATFLAVEMRPDHPTLTWGTYVDRIVVDGDRARFAARRITIDGTAAL